MMENLKTYLFLWETISCVSLTAGESSRRGSFWSVFDWYNNLLKHNSWIISKPFENPTILPTNFCEKT